MRTKFTNSELAHVWAQQNQSEGNGSNFYFVGDTIYSYGPHFPIARFVSADIVLFTSDTYRQTTAKHISLTRRAIDSDITVIEVPIVRDGDSTYRELNLRYLVNQSNECVESATRRRIATYAEMDLERAQNYAEMATQYAALIKWRKKAILSDLPDLAGLDLAEIKKRAIERERAAKEAKKKRLAKEAKEWLNGERASLTGYPEILFRANSDKTEIETSEGAKVPYSAAIALWRAIHAGKPVEGLRIGFYTVDKVQGDLIKIGCHKMSLKSWDKFAKKEGFSL